MADDVNRSWRAVIGAVARRPDLWPIAVSRAWAFRRRSWWRRPPFLPVPSPALVRFRMVTAYGGEGSADGGSGARAVPDAGDVVTWLEWCRLHQPLVAQRRRHGAAAE